MKRILEIGGVVAGVVLIAFGAAAIVLANNGKNTIASELKFQQITGTPDMSPSAIKAEVEGAAVGEGVRVPDVHASPNVAITNGDQARCFGQYMKVHTLEATQGVPYALMGRYVALPDAPKSALTPDGATNDPKYAQLDPKTQQPVENGARNIWVTYTSLTGALNASYMAEQMANFGIVVGIALLLSGFGFVILALGGALENQWAFAKKPAAETAKATAVSV